MEPLRDLNNRAPVQNRRLIPMETAPSQRFASIPEGSLWMVGISIALFFLPLINGLIAGIVGGYKVGSLKRALIAAILPSIVVALGLWGIIAAFGEPGWGALAGMTIGVVVALADIGIFIGAAIGGIYAGRRYPAGS